MASACGGARGTPSSVVEPELDELIIDERIPPTMFPAMLPPRDRFDELDELDELDDDPLPLSW